MDNVIFAAHDGGAIYSLVSTDRLLIRYLYWNTYHQTLHHFLLIVSIL